MVPNTVLREYNHSTDYEQVSEVCKNVYNGTDRVPSCLHIYSRSAFSLPHVVSIDGQVIAFINAIIIQPDDVNRPVYHVEALRVADIMRGRGIGTYMLEQLLLTLQKRNPSAESIRFLSSTIPANITMCHIFNNSNWACRGHVNMWPSKAAMSALKNDVSLQDVPLLQALGVKNFVGENTLTSMSQWVQISDPSQIIDAMQQIREAGGSYLLPGYYASDTAIGASRFLDAHYAEPEQRSIWLLQRPNKPPVMVAIRERIVDRLRVAPVCTMSTCAVDVEGAECCVAFGALRLGFHRFIAIFDAAISLDMLKRSKLLSKIKCERYMIYETERKVVG